MKKTAILLQARMGSTRFPGKVMCDLLGKPVIARIVERLSFCQSVPKIIMVTSTNKENQAIIALADKIGIKSFVGEEDDVLDRFYKASKTFNLDVIVRITGDCPFIDPVIVDKVVGAFLSNAHLDYVSNIEPPTFPDGLDVEVFPFHALETMWKEAKERNDREHVTAFIRRNLNHFRFLTIKYSRDLSKLNFALNYQEDITFIKAIYQDLYDSKNPFLLEDILNWLRVHPEFNPHIRN